MYFNFFQKKTVSAFWTVFSFVENDDHSMKREQWLAKLYWEKNPGELWVSTSSKKPVAQHRLGGLLCLSPFCFLRENMFLWPVMQYSNTVLPNVRVVEDGDPASLPTAAHSSASMCHDLMPFCHAGSLACVLSRLGRSIWGDTLEVACELLMHPETSSCTINISSFFFHTGFHYIAQAGLELVL